MNFVKTVLVLAGFVALTAGLLSVLAPKATHALIATLVQVTNTPANPVPTADVHMSAAQNIKLSWLVEGALATE